MPFKLTLERVLSYLTFVISLSIYLITLESTVSFWDCGEFITSAAGLQIGHPPGAPLYTLAARVFAAIAPDNQHIALLVNSFSALVSAITITFLFKSLLLLFDITTNGDVKSRRTPLLAAFAASMAFAFTDTFWFSAVEAEVYAFSSLFTAACFWAALKWYKTENGNIYSRWLLLIAYLCGLSYGVHLLNLLIIPAILYLIVSRKYKLNLPYRLAAVTICSLAVGIVMYLFVPLILSILGHMELLFVNVIGLPFNSGTLFGVVLIFAILMLTAALAFYYKHRRLLFYTLCISLFTLGFGSYAMILIRGSENPPMNQNQVDNIFSLKSYLDRDQYGKAPLLYGPYYSAPIESFEVNQPVYLKTANRYEIKSYTINNKYYKSHCTFFPRMYSTDPDHIEAYKSWAAIQPDSVTYKKERGIAYKAECPTFAENLSFFAGYQLWWMYFRYFLWNFSGRQNDMMGNGNVLTGNFITGIGFLDNLMLGSQNNLPDDYANNKAHNKYFLIPLILGFIGLFYQWKKHKDIFIATLLFFFFTGIAIVVFLNQTPYQARERDYAYVGSFYVFAIWMGYGLYFLAQKIDLLKSKTARRVLCSLFLVLPLLLFCQNFDDHNRSGREIARNYAKNFLNSVPENSLLITYGDNDTFPLWYLQMVENIRNDVKVFNYNYLFTSWNPSQLTRKTYDNDAFKMIGSTFYKVPSRLRSALEVDTMLSHQSVKEAITNILEDTCNYKESTSYKKIAYKIPKDIIVLPQLNSNDSSNIELKHRQRITKDQILFLDIIANNYPHRTISFAQTTPEHSYQIFKSNISKIGLNYEFLVRPHVQNDKVNLQMALKSYNYLMNRFSFDSLSHKEYIDDVSKRIINTYRSAFMLTARTLATYKDTTKAVMLITLCNKNIPIDLIPLDRKQAAMVKLLFDLRQDKQALELVKILEDKNLQMLKFIAQLNSFQKQYVVAEKELALQYLNTFSEILLDNGYKGLAMSIQNNIKKYDR